MFVMIAMATVFVLAGMFVMIAMATVFVLAGMFVMIAMATVFVVAATVAVTLGGHRLLISRVASE